MTAVPPLPFDSPVVLLASYALLAALAVLGSLTLGGATVFHTRDRRREALETELRTSVVVRSNWDDPKWDAWVDERSESERRALRSLLRRQLPQTSGEYREALRSLALALDLDEWVRQRLTDRRELVRLDALNWVTYLDLSVDEDRLRRADASPRERGAIARAMARHDRRDGAATATLYLLEDGDGESIPGYGVYTLCELNRRDPGALLSALDDWRSWDRTLVVQALDVLGACEPTAPDVAITRLRECLEADAAVVRTAAVNVLGRYLETIEVGDHVDVDALVTDPSPRVRAAVYRTLSDTDSNAVVETLVAAAVEEEHDFLRYVAAASLAEYFDRRDELPTSLRRQLDWFDQTGDSWQMNWRTQWDLDWEQSVPPEVEA